MKGDKSVNIFLALAAVFAIVIGVLLCTVSKGELHLALNAYHSPWLDYMLRFYTMIADYGVYVIAVALLFYKAGASVIVLAGNLFAALLTQTVKRIVDAPRPLTWFSGNMPDIQLPLVDGVSMNYHHSFPSGHTTAFFALALALSYIIACSQISDNKKRVWQCILFLFAVIGGYSRIYLSQHFAADVLAGCISGTCMTWLVILAVNYWHLDKYAWWSWCVFAKRRKAQQPSE